MQQAIVLFLLAEQTFLVSFVSSLLLRWTKAMHECFRPFNRLSPGVNQGCPPFRSLLSLFFLFFFPSANAPPHRSKLIPLKTRSVMLVLLAFLLVTLLTRMSRPLNLSAEMPDEQRLFHKIMSTYERSVRPSRRASDPVVVKLGISLTQIMDIVSARTGTRRGNPSLAHFRTNGIRSWRRISGWIKWVLSLRLVLSHGWRSGMERRFFPLESRRLRWTEENPHSLPTDLVAGHRFVQFSRWLHTRLYAIVGNDQLWWNCFLATDCEVSIDL